MNFEIGIIGIGEIGSALVNNLYEKNYSLSIYNRSISKLTQYLSLDIEIFDNPYDLIERVDYVLFCVSDDKAINIFIDKEKLKRYKYTKKYFIDLSSISEYQAKCNYDICNDLNIQYFDAPISGGVEGARNGSLSIMVGGNKKEFHNITFILNDISTKYTYLGKAGSGSVTKLINQIIVASYLSGIAEAFAFADTLGLDIKSIYNAISDGYAQSNVMNSKLTNYLQNTYDKGGKVTLHKKDLLNACKTAHNNGLNLELTKYIIEKFDQIIEAGYGDKDHSILFEQYKKIIKEDH